MKQTVLKLAILSLSMLYIPNLAYSLEKMNYSKEDNIYVEKIRNTFLTQLIFGSQAITSPRTLEQQQFSVLFGYNIKNDPIAREEVLNFIFKETTQPVIYLTALKRNLKKEKIYDVKPLLYINSRNRTGSKEEFLKWFFQQEYEILAAALPSFIHIENGTLLTFNLSNKTMWSTLLKENKIAIKAECMCYEKDIGRSDFTGHVSSVAYSVTEARRQALEKCPIGEDLFSGPEESIISKCNHLAISTTDSRQLSINIQ